MSAYQPLSGHQIDVLTGNGCTCNDWSKIYVSKGFNAQNVRHSIFSGQVYLGDNQSVVSFPGGIQKNCGIYHAFIHNCTIGNDVYISQVKNYIANYDISDRAVIENIELLAVEEESTFGNGDKVAVLDETGGRSIMMYDRLSAHLAYIMTFYKHRDQLINWLEGEIKKYMEQVKSSRGLVGEESVIVNCRQIRNVKFGPCTQARGAMLLENGSVNSTHEAPVVLGSGTIAQHFIIASGAELLDGAIVSHCFIGQGCVLGKQYSAENCLFFANCQGFHGEACSVFAGPYTVTHHKSTLLIAGMFSFCNAGSGSNQSNHMYKLGPIHHGIVERGSKTTSDSYVLWPAKIGAFSLVMGRHYKNTDTSDLPFSYLIENKDESWLSPAVNLQSVGTIRDVIKWPKRDRRKDSDKLDCINFNLLSPFTVQKMQKGMRILESLKSVSGETTETFAYRSTLIKRHALERGIDLYRKAIYKFIGNSLISRIESCPENNWETILNELTRQVPEGKGEWSDLAGLIAPQQEIHRLLEKTELGDFNSITELEIEFSQLHANYYEFEWSWAADLLSEYSGKRINDFTLSDLKNWVEKWLKSVVEIDQVLYRDAQKEFRLDAMTGFGMDGNEQTRQLDFEKVRGSFESNSFVKEIHNHINRKTKLAENIMNRLEQIKHESIEV